MKPRYLISSLAGCWLAFASSDALACNLRYASQLAEVSATLQADIKAKALKAVSSSLENSLGERPSVTARLDARYSVVAAGGMARSAYSETVSGFFCELREKWANDSTKLTKLDEAERDILLTLDQYFDIGLWLGDGIAARNAIREELRAMPVPAPPFSKAEVDGALSNPNFDLVKIAQIGGSIEFANAAEIGGCIGVVRRSVRLIDGDVLSGLGLIRPMLVKWLSGDSVSARLDLWTFAGDQMSKQLIRATAPPVDVPLTPTFLACVKKAENTATNENNEAKKKEQAATATTSGTGTGTPASNTETVKP